MASSSHPSAPAAAQAFWSFARTTELPDLGPGPRSGVLSVRELGRHLEVWNKSVALAPTTAQSVRAVALLYHDHHDAAHDLVQDGRDPETALIHAILHRREPDFWNAKYWFRRIGNHGVYRQLQDRLPGLVSRATERDLVGRLSLTGSIDPFVLVDEVERVTSSSTSGEESGFLRRVQQAEFEALVEHLIRDGEDGHRDDAR